jgi:hypothetical protein
MNRHQIVLRQRHDFTFGLGIAEDKFNPFIPCDLQWKIYPDSIDGKFSKKNWVIVRSVAASLTPLAIAFNALLRGVSVNVRSPAPNVVITLQATGQR